MPICRDCGEIFTRTGNYNSQEKLCTACWLFNKKTVGKRKDNLVYKFKYNGGYCCHRGHHFIGRGQKRCNDTKCPFTEECISEVKHNEMSK